MKILVSDFDDSFYTKDYSIEEAVKKIKEFRNKGNKFILATGRSVTNLLKELSNYDPYIYDYLLCNDGSIIYDSNLSELFRDDLIHENRHGIVMMLNASDAVTKVTIDNGYDFLENPDSEGVRLIGTLNTEKRDEAVKLLNEVLDKYKDYTGYLSNYYMMILNNYMDKGYALNKLCELENLNKDDIYTLGDEVNDYQLVRDFKGYAVEGANKILDNVKTGTVKNIGELIDLIEKEDV